MAINKKNAIWNSFSFVFLSVATFVTFTIIYKTYGANELGLFLIISSIFGLGNTFDFGFGLASIKYISEFKTKDDYKQINTFISTFLFIYAVIAAVLILFIFIYFTLFIKNSNITENFPSDVVNGIFIFLSLSFLFKYLSNYLKIILEAFKEFVLLSKFNVFTNFFNILLVSTLLFGKHDIVYVAILNLIFNFTSFLVFVILIFRFDKKLKIHPRHFSIAFIKKFTLYGVNIQIASFFSSLIDTLIKYFLGNFLSLSYVTLFELSKKVIDFTNGLIFSAQKGIFNVLSEELAKKKLSDYLNTSLYKYSRMANFYSVLVYGVLNPLLCYFILIWSHNESTVVIFLIFAMPYSLINFGSSLYQVIMVEGSGGTLMVIQIINVVTISVFLFLSIIIFKNYLGLISFYAATVISIGILFYYLKKSHSLNYLEYLKKTEFSEIIKLNILLILQIYCLYSFTSFLEYILAAFLILFTLFFRKYIFEAYKSIMLHLKSNKFLKIS
jgi:O-antigen/teichoic acid export membrane protein